jgi:TRAPP trafficking subunit Trs65
MNLLQPFARDPSLVALNPHLSASRLTNLNPGSAAPSPRPLTRGVRTGPRRLFRAAPALLWRLRFAKLPDSPSHESLLASLDFEVTNFAGSDLCLDTVTLSLLLGRVERLDNLLPLICRPGDQCTLLFRLIPEKTITNAASTDGLGRDLIIKIVARSLVSETCKPKIHINWKTHVDMSSARPPSRAGPIHHQLGRPTGAGSRGSKDLSKLPGPDALLSITDTESMTTVAAGVSLTVAGPKTVEVGQAFEWSIFVVNRSEKVQRLAIVTMPKRTRLEGKRPDTAGSVGPGTGADERNAVDANQGPIMDDESVYHLQRSAILDPAELICLSPDVRIG